MRRQSLLRLLCGSCLLLVIPVVHPLPASAASRGRPDPWGRPDRMSRADSTVGAAGGVMPSSMAARLAASPGSPALRGPVDEKQYVVGPGDAFAITVAGGSVDSYRAEVTPEGDVVLPGIATTAVAGLLLVDAKKAIGAALARQYRNVEVHISLVQLRHIEVHVIGDVVRPGIYVGTALDPTGTMIEAAGGLGEDASRRNIRVTRRNGDERRIDLVRYERLGDLDANPPILDGDVIFVPFAKTQLQIDGAVESPGTYEFVDGDKAGDLIDIAGGLTRDASRDSIEVLRFDDGTRTQAFAVALEPDGRAMPLRDGDQVHVRFLRDYQPTTSVTLEGEFIHPGPYGIREGVDRLSDVIHRAGGFSTEASLPEALLIRTTGVEQMDLEYERLKTIPVQDMSQTEYAYFKSKARERKGLVVADFQRLADGDSKEDRLLQGGDRVVVPKKRATVKVSGSVKYPGLITYAAAEKASYYIEQAGGYASHADEGEARVIRSTTGEWEPLGRAGVIVPGDEVWVPEAPERNWWQFAQDAVRFAASIATVYLVIQQATR
ncbi:MAG: SLBB domain-containing protein [bacterium]